MSSRSYTSRTEFTQYRFSALVTVAVPFVFVLLQVYLPRAFPRLLYLDLPLLAVIFFSVGRRNPIAGAVTGAVIGLFQDLLTGQPIGIFGLANTVIGYLASSIGLEVDVEAIPTRILMNFSFSLIDSGLLFLIERYLLGSRQYRFLWIHELIRAGVNTAVAIPLFSLLDRTKQRE
jgi:rod shape-determining protein MreD